MHRFRVLHLALDGDLFGMAAHRRGERRRRGKRAALRVYEHGAAIFFQRLEPLGPLEHEALEHERRVGPRPVQLDDVHAELKFFHLDAFLHCGLPPGRLDYLMREDSQVLVERCAFVYRRIAPALAVSAALSVLLSAALWGSRPKELIVFWQAVMFLLIFTSAALWWAY